MSDTYTPTHRVRCDCGFDERYASDAVASTVYSDHDEMCGYNTVIEEVGDT